MDCNGKFPPILSVLVFHTSSFPRPSPFSVTPHLTSRHCIHQLLRHLLAQMVPETLLKSKTPHPFPCREKNLEGLVDDVSRRVMEIMFLYNKIRTCVYASYVHTEGDWTLEELVVLPRRLAVHTTVCRESPRTQRVWVTRFVDPDVSVNLRDT